MSATQATVNLGAVLARKRRAAALVLWIERLAPALAPSATLMLAFAAAALAGLPAHLPPLAALALLTAAAAAVIILAWRRLIPVVQPAPDELDRRLERHEPHRPLATLADRPAWDGAEEVWQAHRERALTRLPHLHAGPPRLPAALAAPLAGALLLVVIGLIAAGPRAGPRLWAAFAPPARLPSAPAPRLQAWIVPPPRMGLAPIFLHDPTLLHDSDPAIVTVPVGARLTVSVAGGTDTPVLGFAAHRQRFRRLDQTAYQAELVLAAPTLDAPAMLSVTRDGRRLAAWRLNVAADQPPTIQVTGPAALQDQRLRLPWRAADDYGLAGITAEARLQDRPGAPPLIVSLPLAGLPRTAQGSALPDLTANPWAGLPVLLRFVARDGGGQRGISADVPARLPERVFLNPIARALIGIRRRLVLDPADTAPATAALDRLSTGPATKLLAGQWLNLRAVAALLFEQPDAPEEAQARLWQLAVQIEDAGVQDAKRQLADARTALQDALDRPDAAADASRRTEALGAQLQQALQRYMQALAQQADRAGQPPPDQANGRKITPDQLQQMARQLTDAARAGRMQDAKSRLQQLGQLLDNLRPSARQKQAQGGAAPQTDPALDQLQRDQKTLQGRADQRLSETADPRAGPAPERDPDEATGQPDPSSQRKTDQQAQGGLRQKLGALAQKLGDQSGTVPDGLARADGAMRDAQAALARGDDAAARAAQQRALDGLQAGGRQMAQQQQGQQGGGAGQGQGQGQGQQQQAGPGTDPLGRSLAEGGKAPDESDSIVNMNGDAASSRALRDELRRRGADRTRPQPELDYIDRLLRPGQ